MILIVTNQFDPTSDMVIGELRKRGIAFERFNTEQFPTKVNCTVAIDASSFDASLELPSGRHVSTSEIKSIYYRRSKQFELDSGLSFEQARIFALNECRAAIGGLWMTLPGLWVNHPANIRVAEFKIHQLRLADKLGFRIPKTLVTNDPKRVRDFYRQCGQNMIAKVLRTGMIEYDDDVLLIYTTRLLETHLDYIQAVKYAPCLFQEYIAKKLEIRASVVGNQVFSAEIHSQSSPRTKDDWRRYDLTNTPHLPHVMPELIEKKCIGLIKSLNLNYGAIDLILTPEGEYYFLEINPNGLWGWIEELTGLQICSAIVDLLNQGNPPTGCPKLL